MISDGFSSSSRRFLGFLAAVMLFLALAAALVWPVWYLATHRRGLFNFGVASLALLLLVLGAVRLFRANRPGSGSRPGHGLRHGSRPGR